MASGEDSGSSRGAGSTNRVVLEVEESPAREDVDALRQGLTEHARSFVDRPGFRPLAVLARDRDGRLRGGVYGYVNWNWLDVSLLWVEEELRGSGIGSRLLRALEAEAVARGCRQAHIDTFNPRAAELYRRLGYRDFAELDDYPPGRRRMYLRKLLSE